jgi:hypothetical protein
MMMKTMVVKLQKRVLIAIMFLALSSSLLLRVASFQWNDRLQGDVNLFALTAREFVLHNRLYYPMKYEFSENVEYLALQSPASQHPPLWPFMAGILGKIFETDDTFLILKLLCEVAGILLLAILAYVGMRFQWPDEILLSIAGISLSPMLVDFSANGSPYILSAVLILLSTILLKRFDYQKLAHYLWAGILCGIGFQIHSVLMFMPMTFFLFWIADRRQVRWQGLLAFFFSAFLVVMPFLIWNLRHFGQPFYSSSTYYLLQKLEIAQIRIYDDKVVMRIVHPIDMTIVRQYLRLVYKTVLSFVQESFWEIGPFCLILSLIGWGSLYRRDRRAAWAGLLPYAFYTATILLWAAFKYRFLVPLLPATIIAAAFGYAALARRGRLWQIVGTIALAGMIAWYVPAFFDPTPTRYYTGDEKHAAQYAQMVPLAKQMIDLPSGVVLGYSDSLDGGRETIYWNRRPYVYAVGFKMIEVQKLVRDFNVRYIWADQTTADQVQSGFPGATVVLSDGFFSVFEIPA